MRYRAFLLLLLAQACGNGDGVAVDSGAADGTSRDGRPAPDGPPAIDANLCVDATPFTAELCCVGLPLPSSAADPLNLPVLVQSFSLNVEGATATARRRSDDMVVASGVASVDGDAPLSIPTGGVAFDGYIEATQPGSYSGRLFPDAPFGDYWATVSRVPVILMTASDEQSIADESGITLQPDTAIIWAHVGDCDNASVSGATVTLDPISGTVMYFSGGIIDPAATSTGQDGLAVIFNVPQDEVDVVTDYLGTELRRVSIRPARPGLTYVIVRP